MDVIKLTCGRFTFIINKSNIFFVLSDNNNNKKIYLGMTECDKPLEKLINALKTKFNDNKLFGVYNLVDVYDWTHSYSLTAIVHENGDIKFSFMPSPYEISFILSDKERKEWIKILEEYIKYIKNNSTM